MAEQNDDKFVSPEKPPEGLERELLTILSEECAEVSQRVCKALRFGASEVQPGQDHSNAERIAHELGDLIAVMERLIDAGVIQESRTHEAARAKHKKLERFLQSA